MYKIIQAIATPAMISTSALNVMQLRTQTTAPTATNALATKCRHPTVCASPALTLRSIV